MDDSICDLKTTLWGESFFNQAATLLLSGEEGVPCLVQASQKKSQVLSSKLAQII